MIIKVTPDKEKVESLLTMVENREKYVSQSNQEDFSTIIAENYYEIIKELATALLLLNGNKAVGESAHKELIDELIKYNFSDEDVNILQDLRIKRNKSMYEGKQIERAYIENNKDFLLAIIIKLKEFINNKLKEYI